MAKFANNLVMDGALDVIAACTRMVVCSAQPTTFTEANVTYALGKVTLDSGDFTKANGDTSGRKVTVAAQTGITIDTTGTANHVALLNVGTSALIYVTTCTAQGVSSGGTTDTNAFDIEIADPA